jgi:hypothetical protein
MSRPGEGGGGNGAGADAQAIMTPHVIVSFDPKTYQVTIAGRSPNLEFARYMLYCALESTEKQIRERDTPRIATAGGAIPFPVREGG